jgi:ubiquinone/menaquinone biosynthesis C-methylase UbiE
MNVIKIFEEEWNTSCSYEKTFYVSLIVFVMLIIWKHFKQRYFQEGLENNSPNAKYFKSKFVIRKSLQDIYDSFYVSLYDKIFFDQYRYQCELNSIVKHTKINKTSNVLDIGSGTGHILRGLHPYTKNVQGIDVSNEMIKKSKRKYPYIMFRHGNAMDNMMYEPNTFTHVLAMYFSLYMFKDKYGILNNVYSWLRPNGYFVVHVVNRRMFDPIVAPANPVAFVSVQKYAKNRITKSTVKFNDFTYKSDFKLDDSNNKATFEETLKHDNTGNIIQNIHTVHAPSLQEILKLAEKVGFKIIQKVDMIECEYEYQYLYILQK